MDPIEYEPDYIDTNVLNYMFGVYHKGKYIVNPFAPNLLWECGSGSSYGIEKVDGG